MTDEQIKDAVTGEQLSAFNVQMADGRQATVTARDADTARAVAREQHGNVGVLSVESADTTDEPNTADDSVTFTPSADADISGPDDDSEFVADDNGEPTNPVVNDAGQVSTPQGSTSNDVPASESD